ncbi:N-acetylglucosamine kinase [Ornithinibacillus sp. 179-J 7C1 HS]|uniref:N-acetylglucosamine kinase n=1 Tax=Ornithinibacillus sp. 179-J 7C1 HS TaxID=3142384 RepID=UPI0039A1EE5C
MKYVVGIDGGGTKTAIVLADLDGNVLMNRTYGSTNPNAVSKEELERTFQQIFQHIKEKLKGNINKVVSVFAGISGAGSKASLKLLEEIITPNFLPATKITVVVDTINALYSGTFGKPGIVQICGTGSITYGMNDQKKQDRVGGWGYLLGDEGSGYDVGQKGIAAALRFVDGRGPNTVILDLLYEYFQVEEGRALIDNIYHSHNPRLEISKVSRIVFKAVDLHDQVALEIINDVSKEISLSIYTLYQKLFRYDEQVEVILCGGLFSNQEILPGLIQENIKGYTNKLSFTLPELPPVAGSVIGAYIELDRSINEIVKKKLREFWK